MEKLKSSIAYDEAKAYIKDLEKHSVHFCDDILYYIHDYERNGVFAFRIENICKDYFPSLGDKAYPLVKMCAEYVKQKHQIKHWCEKLDELDDI